MTRWAARLPGPTLTARWSLAQPLSTPPWQHTYTYDLGNRLKSITKPPGAVNRPA